MFSGLTYFFDHSIYFARLCHVNPLCKHEYAFLQMKEAPNQKVQEKKPLLKFKNTKKYMCLERIWRKKCFWACRHRPLIHVLHIYTSCDENSSQDIQCPSQDIPLVWANFSTISMPFMCHWCSDIISLSNSLWTIALGWWSTTHSWQVLQPLFW